MKIGIINDTHIRQKNSINRLGNMYDDMMLKLDESIGIFKKCDFIIHLGDLWDSALVSNTTIDDFIDKIEASGKTWYVLPGNHDMIGANWLTSDASALAHTFRRSKSIKLLTSLEFEDCCIIGYPYYFGIEEDFKNKGLFVDNSKYKIACTHGFISIKPFLSQVLHVQAKDLKKCNYDLVLCSHFHTIFDETINGCRFWNNGAWGRHTIREHDHSPQVAILDTKTKKIEAYPLKSAKKGSEIFDLSKKEEDVEFDGKIEAFISELKDLSTQSLDIKSTIELLGKKNKIEKQVISLLINKVQELEREGV